MVNTHITAILFEKSLKRVNKILRVSGTQLKDDDTNRTLVQRLRYRFIYCFNVFWHNSDLICEIAWFFNGAMTGKSLTELTYVLPCIFICLLANMKGYCCIKYAQHLNEIVHILRKLETIQNHSGTDRKEIIEEFVKKRYPYLNRATNILTFINVFLIFFFALSPLMLTALNYFRDGELNLLLPFLMLYPFDAFNIKIWPFIFVHQIWSGVIAVFSIFGPDCFYYTCCTFIHINFRSIQYDMERIIGPTSNGKVQLKDVEFQRKFVDLIKRHKALLRCVDLLEIIYSKSALLNALTSSTLICLTGFNVTVNNNLLVIAPFVMFLVLSLFQIYLFCYYGDDVLRSSTGLSDSVYNSQWYNADASVGKDLLIVLTRAQKPCKLTAYGFADINLRAFTRILSTSWSYFALLKTIYRTNKIEN